MFQGLSNASAVVAQAGRAVATYPRFLIALLLCWLFYAPVLVYIEFGLPWDRFHFGQQIGISFGLILALSLIFTWTAFVLLELLRQIETGSVRCMGRAFAKALAHTVLAMPIAVAWAVLWLVISLIECVVRRGESGEEDEEFNAENVAETLAGYEQMSFSGAFFDALKKGVRMLAFIMYPAIAWERLGTFRSVRRGIGIAKTHRGEFASGFVLTEIVAALVFLPPAILFYCSGRLER